PEQARDGKTARRRQKSPWGDGANRSQRGVAPHGNDRQVAGGTFFRAADWVFDREWARAIRWSTNFHPTDGVTGWRRHSQSGRPHSSRIFQSRASFRSILSTTASVFACSRAVRADSFALTLAKSALIAAISCSYSRSATSD